MRLQLQLIPASCRLDQISLQVMVTIPGKSHSKEHKQHPAMIKNDCVPQRWCEMRTGISRDCARLREIARDSRTSASFSSFQVSYRAKNRRQSLIPSVRCLINSLWPQENKPVLYSRSARYNCSDLDLAVIYVKIQKLINGVRIPNARWGWGWNTQDPGPVDKAFQLKSRPYSDRENTRASREI